MDFGISSAIAALFLKISSLLDLFDLSFFISGAIWLSGIFFILDFLEVTPLKNTDVLLKNFLFIIFCYGLGLISFSIGRFFRKSILGRFIGLFDMNADNGSLQRELSGLLTYHGLKEKGFLKIYNDIENKSISACLYQRLWVEVRQSRELIPSLNMLNKWWSMSAAYDGIGIGLLFWAFLVIFVKLTVIGTSVICEINLFNDLFYYLTFFLLVAASIFSFREAARLEYNQLQELIATISYKYY